MKKFLGWLKKTKRTKRWILLMIIGMILVCYGFAQVLVLDRLEILDIVKIVITFVAGFVAFITGIIFIQRRTLERAVLQDAKSIEKLGDAKDRGPKIVVIGGGIGITKIIAGLKNYTNNLTAIVTVSTYGNEQKRKPTDNIRNSLIALAKDSTAMAKLMNYPTSNGTFADMYLNVVANTNKDLVDGIKRSSSVLSIIGKVLPATLDEMSICVELEDGTVIEDKEKIADITTSRVTKIDRVFIKPTNCRTAPGIVESIQEADAIILGPGALYTEVIPNLLVKNVAKAIRDSKAYKIFVANIMTQSGHTDDYTLSDHIKAIKEHAGNKIVDYCICDNGDIVPEILRKYNKAGASLVEIDKQNLKGLKIIRADVSQVEGEYITHDADETAKQIIEIIFNDLKFKDQKNNEHYILLNAKLKEMKKKLTRKKRHTRRRKTTQQKTRSKSKFSNKYQERITSIRESEKTTSQNRKKAEKAKHMSSKSGTGKRKKEQE